MEVTNETVFLFVTALMVILAPLCVSYAADTTITGEYRVRGWSEWNFAKEAGAGLPSGADSLYTGFFDQRFRLTDYPHAQRVSQGGRQG